MVNRLTKTMLLLFLVAITHGQDITRQDADSMLNALKKSKPGIDRIELLLSLAQFHVFKPGENQMDFDSATVYINEAKTLNKTVNSPVTYGYLVLTEAYLTKEKGQKEEGKKMVEQAIKVFESGKNKDYLGQAYYELATYYDYNDSVQFSKRIALIQESIDAFQQAGDPKRKAMSLVALGDLYTQNISDFPNSILALKQALAIYDSLKYQNLQGVYVLLGVVYQNQTDYPQALFYLLKALKSARSTKDSSMQLCQIYNHLGIVYYYIDRLDVAVKYYNDALDIARKYNDEGAIYNLAVNLCSSYNRLDQPDQSLKVLGYISKNYRESDDIPKKYSISSSYLKTYVALKQLSNAYTYLGTVLDLANKKMVPVQQQNNTYRYVATYYFLKNQFSKARFYLKKSFEAGKDISWEYGKIQNLQLLYKLDSAQGDMQSAFKNLFLYKEKTDSVSSVRKITQFEAMNLEYEVGMKEDSIKLQEKDILLLTQTNSLQNAKLQRTSLVKNVTIGGIILALIIIGLLYNRYRSKQRTNKTLELQQGEIADQNLSLRRLVNEKDWLVKEIHHRVKNNLQTVMSLLGTQSSYLKNDIAKNAITDSQRRIQSMSLIHQRLYNANDLSAVRMADFIHELVDSLNDSFDIGNRIRFNMEIEPVELDLAHSIPLGLILNEAITNSFKYAFPGEQQGVINISLKNTSENNFLLIIKDNGIGLPAGFNATRSNSMGMNLMRGLSQEIGAQFTLSSQNGAKIEISFAYDPNNDVEIA